MPAASVVFSRTFRRAPTTPKFRAAVAVAVEVTGSVEVSPGVRFATALSTATTSSVPTGTVPGTVKRAVSVRTPPTPSGTRTLASAGAVSATLLVRLPWFARNSWTATAPFSAALPLLVIVSFAVPKSPGTNVAGRITAVTAAVSSAPVVVTGTPPPPEEVPFRTYSCPGAVAVVPVVSKIKPLPPLVSEPAGALGTCSLVVLVTPKLVHSDDWLLVPGARNAA